MPPQKSKGRTGLRSLEDSTLLLLVFAVSVAFAWILWPFFGALLWAAVLAIVFTPLHEWLLRAMPKRQNLPALATVLIILTLVILPLTLTAASLVQEAANFHESMQGGLVESWRVLSASPCRVAVVVNRPLGPPRAERPRRGASEAIRGPRQRQRVLCLRGARYRARHHQLPRQ